MLELTMVEPSQASEWSQVHLVLKKLLKLQQELQESFPMTQTAQDWRFCVDYRNNNDASPCLGWPLPNIGMTLQRIGARKPKFFAKFDMTKGYFQCPISKASRKYTAFITFMGLYPWTRLPMGLKGAGAYFQCEVATTVLVGLLYIICEQYLDGIITDAKSEDELIANLRQLFERFRKYKITLNPDKCELGSSQIEYTGHLIDSEGLSFTEDKLQGVRAFPLPYNHKAMKSFLGLVNYFRDHVRDLSTKVYPLQRLIDGYTSKSRNKPIAYTAEMEALFEEVKFLVSRCQKLYFINDISPIFLETDASDYGIGGYLYQVIDGVNHTIMFLSKSLTKQQQRWSVPEKECYAIVQSFEKMEHLIKDRFFTLRTDHENLTRTYSSGSAKVLRWKMQIQEYIFGMEFLKGEDNPIADGLSRLCPIIDQEESDWANAIGDFDPSSVTSSVQVNSVLHATEEFDFINNIETLNPPLKRMSDEVYKSISSVHKSVTGHHGVDRTCDKLIRLGKKFPYMRSYVREFIKKCPCCQKLSYVKISIHTHPFTNSTYAPMQRIAIDSIGPLPPTEEGEDTIFVIIALASDTSV